MIEISKELLCEVLNKEVTDFSVHTGFIWFKYKDYSSNINTYELAHRCKEWAFAKGFLYWYENNELYIKRLYSCKVDFVVDIGNYNKPFEIDIDFKSCQWILSNKGNL